MKSTIFGLIFLIGFMALSRSLPGQSVNLVEMKKKEAERRKKIEKPRVSLSDDNIGKIVVTNQSYSFMKVEPETSVPATAVGDTEGAAVDTGEPATADETKSPEYWKTQKKAIEDRIRELRDGIARDELTLNKLWTDFYVQGKADQQLQLKVQISQISSQVENNKDFLRRAETDLNNLFERARKGGVPPGWLR
jgi:hypothetical protein